MITEQKYHLAYWSRTNETRFNFGDALNETILPWMTQGEIRHSGNAFFPRNPFSRIICGVGSILDGAKFIERPTGRRVVVWGSGSKGMMKNANHLLSSNIAAVRGPKTRKMLQDLGVANLPKIYGDPAMLVPEIWPELRGRSSGRPIIVAHYKDLDHAEQVMAAIVPGPDQPHMVNVFDPPKRVVEQIASASLVISSSLHGLIIADAFSIPSAWVTFGNDLGGGEFKFQDHFLAVWGRERVCHAIRSTGDIQTALDSAALAPPFSTTPLKQALLDALST